MDSVSRIASSGLTINLFPTQLAVGAGLLGVFLVSNAKSLLFAWHVKIPSQFTQLFRTNSSRDDSFTNLHGISFFDELDLQ